jgi:hypothetical protein
MANLRAGTAPAGDIKAPKKGMLGLIVLLALVILILIFIALTAFNAFGLRDNMLYPLLRNVPVIGNMIPDPIYGEAEGVDIAVTVAELEAETYTLAAENASLEAQLENLTGTIEQLERENARLAEFEALHEERTAQREAFDRDLAMENPEAFMNFFETTHPGLAEELFISITQEQFDEERWRNYLASWINMNPLQVANVIESMLTTDMRLIVRVMLELPEPFRGNILNSLAPDSAAAVLRQMEP